MLASPMHFLLGLFFLCHVSQISFVSTAYTDDYTGYMAMDPNGNIYFPRQSYFTVRDITPWRFYIYLYLHKVRRNFTADSLFNILVFFYILSTLVFDID
jgi:hypothetical protein